jgi:hypothetical protein
VIAALSMAWASESVSVPVEGAVIEVELPAELQGPARAELLAFVVASSQTVSGYYRGFPVPRLRLAVTSMGGRRVSGSTWPGDPPVVQLSVGLQADRAAYDADWVLVHELVHTAFPHVDRRHHWIEEGLATYVEPWARVAAGRLAPERAWYEFARDLPQGQPDASGLGLDRDGSWAATYWGGALYCFVADLEIRERTGGRFGLRDALVAIARAGGIGGGEVHDLAKVLAVGDAAVGVPVLTETWRAMAVQRKPVDLQRIWTELGVELRDGTARLVTTAPKAAVREAIAASPARTE